MTITDCSSSSYLLTALVPELRKIIIRELCDRIKIFGMDKFDTIVFRGMSGSLIAPSVADHLNKPMLFVRKERTEHSSYQLEGHCKVQNYIIIDDLIFSGETVQAM